MATAAARRYAKAVFELAQSEGQVDQWHQRLARASELLGQHEVVAVLGNPTLDVKQRMELIASLGAFDAEATNLVDLLIESNRVSEVGDIAAEFERLADEAAGRVRAVVTTAIELPREDRERIARQLSTRLNKEVRIDAVVDPRILGGLRVQYGDRVVDASVSSKLQQLRRRLASVS